MKLSEKPKQLCSLRQAAPLAADVRYVYTSTEGQETMVQTAVAF